MPWDHSEGTVWGARRDDGIINECYKWRFRGVTRIQKGAVENGAEFTMRKGEKVALKSQHTAQASNMGLTACH